MRHALVRSASVTSTSRIARSAAVALAFGAAMACNGDRAKSAGGETGGTLIISAPADPDILFPPLVATIEGKRSVDLVFDHLAEIGDSLNTIGDHGFTPVLAEKWDWAADSLSIAFHLNPKARWHDGAPVRAEDVKLTYELTVDPIVNSQVKSNIPDIDSVSVRDSLTPVIWYKRRTPEQFFEAVYNLSILPAHILSKIPRADLKSAEFGRHPIGTGRFRFAKWTPGASVEFVADTLNYRGRAKLDRVITLVSPDYTTAATKLFGGEADFFENLRADNIGEIAKHPQLTTHRRAAFDYGFMAFNLTDHASSRPHPIFADRGVRRALTMAMDRAAMVKSVMDTLGMLSVGPVTADLGGAPGARQIPYDTAAAARLLDSLGWKDTNGDGIREKGGRPLAFTLIVPTSSKVRMDFSVLIQEQLKRIGAKVTLDPLEFNTFVQRQGARDFDATLLAWSADPSPSGGLKQAWGSAGLPSKGGNNYGSYVSPAFDAQVDSGAASFDPAAARRHYAAAYQTIIDDAPAVWLYEPHPFFGIAKRIRPVGVRGDAWWAHLADWTVDPAQRIPRDEIGLRPR